MAFWFGRISSLRRKWSLFAGSNPGWNRVTPPSTPGTMRFLMRTLANVPRVITRSLPRRDP